MVNDSAKKTIQHILKYADVKINGTRAWDIQVNNENVYRRVINQGSIGLGESYMEGMWDAKEIDQFFYKILRADLDKKVELSVKDKYTLLKYKLFNLQTRKGSLRVAKEHYDLSNEMYMSFLDPYNQYTCGYFKDTTDLNTAQEKKLDLICRKLQLNSKDKVLDIGCGWGGFAKYASSKFGCNVTGITISEEQAKYAKEFCKNLPVSILLKDYRDLAGKYDKILICGMIEHVGRKNYREIMEIVSKVLEDSGLFLLHTIGAGDSNGTIDPWIDKYIFPNSELPTMAAIGEASDKLLIMEDWHNFGAYYDPTLMAWFKNFERNWYKFENQYDQRFFRMFKYYFLLCAGSFRARKNQLWQIVYSKNGIEGGYKTQR